jgi:hypothetical protein
MEKIDEIVDSNAPISLLVEIPSDLFEGMKEYLATHPGWDQDRVFTAALSLLLLQLPGPFQRRASRIYLETLFAPCAAFSSALFKRGGD